MNTKPEALRLADDCDEGMVDFAEAAAELRRLSAWNARLTILAKQRDELLEALRGYVNDYSSEDGMYTEKHYVKVFSEVIAKVEGEKQ